MVSSLLKKQRRIFDSSSSPSHPVSAPAILSDTEPAVQLAQKSGIVKFFDGRTGTGFIIPADGSGDVFFHRRAVVGKRLRPGDAVRYEEDVEGNKPRAAKVTGMTGVSHEFISLIRNATRRNAKRNAKATPSSRPARPLNLHDF